MHNKPIAIAATFYHNYIELAPKNDIVNGLKKNHKELMEFLDQLPKNKINYAYAEGKWTIKQLLQHMTDAERVFAFRALWIARASGTALPGFDENVWADRTDVTKRKWKDMIEEWDETRKSTISLFDSFTTEEILLTGIVNQHEINVAALGYICAGHTTHHLNIITERYLTTDHKK